MAQQRVEQFKGVGARTVEAQPSVIQRRIEGLVALVDPNFVIEENHVQAYYDHYLATLAVIITGPGEVAITPPLLPGLADHDGYYRRVGILTGTERILEVAHDGSHESPYGYPAGNSLHNVEATIRDGRRLADDQGAELQYAPNGQNGGALQYVDGRGFVHIPTFNADSVRRDTRKLGMASVEQPDFTVTNNKVALREAHEQYGIRMFPGGTIYTPEELLALEQRYPQEKYPNGIWIKMAGGVGGETLLHVKQVTAESLLAAVEELRGRELSALTQGEFGITGEQEWPQGEISPNHTGLSVELDAHNLGDVVFVGSNHFVTKASGEVELLGCFQQVTSADGEFIGSRKIHPEGELLTQIEEQTQAAGRYNIEANGFYGIQGIDYVVIKLNQDYDGHKAGELVVVTIELNTRPIISTYADFAGRKIGHDDWLNVNVALPTPVTEFADFERQMVEQSSGESLLYMPEKGYGVMPLAFKTVTGKDGTRTIPDEYCKLLLVGTPQQQEELVARLKAMGIAF